MKSITAFSYPTAHAESRFLHKIEICLSVCLPRQGLSQFVVNLIFTYKTCSKCYMKYMEHMLLKNSSRNSTGQLTNDTVLGITAAICCIICLLVLVALSVCAKCYSQSTVCGSTVKRLAVGLIVPTMLYQLVLALHLLRNYPERTRKK